jgi:hypothetical protein
MSYDSCRRDNEAEYHTVFCIYKGDITRIHQVKAPKQAAAFRIAIDNDAAAGHDVRNGIYWVFTSHEEMYYMERFSLLT